MYTAVQGLSLRPNAAGELFPPEATRKVSVRGSAVPRTQHTEGVQMIIPPPGPQPQGSALCRYLHAPSLQVCSNAPSRTQGAPRERRDSNSCSPCSSLGQGTRYNVNEHAWTKYRDGLNLPTTHLVFGQMEAYEDPHTVH